MARGTSTKARTTTTTPAPVADPTPTDVDTTTPADAAPVDTTPAPVADPTPTDTADAGTTPDTTPADAAPAADPADAFRAAWSAATDAADTTTGTVPPAALAAVHTAWRALGAKGKRDSAVVEQQAADTARAMSDGPLALGRDPWRAVLLGASAAIAEHLRSTGTAPAAPRVTLADQAVSMLGALAALSGDGAPSVKVYGPTDGEVTVTFTVSADALSSAAPTDGDRVLSDEEALMALAAYVTADPSDRDTAAVVRARGVLKASAGKRAAGSTGGTRSAGGGARVTGAAAKPDGGTYSVAEHIRQALEVLGAPAKDSAVRAALTDAYPTPEARPSAGAIGSVSESAASAAGIRRVTVGGRNGWDLS